MALRTVVKAQFIADLFDPVNPLDTDMKLDAACSESALHLGRNALIFNRQNAGANFEHRDFRTEGGKIGGHLASGSGSADHQQ